MKIAAIDSPTGRTWTVQFSEKEFFDALGAQLMVPLLQQGLKPMIASLVAARTLTDSTLAALAGPNLTTFGREGLAEFARLGVDPNLDHEAFLATK